VKKSIKIACVGGGLVGVLTAYALQRLIQPLISIEIHIFERYAKDTSDSGISAISQQYDTRNLVLSSATVTFLKQLGLWDILQPALAPIADLYISRQKGLGRSHISAQSEAVAALGYVADMSQLSQLLSSNLTEGQQNIFFHYGVTLDELTPKSYGYDLNWHQSNERIKNSFDLLLAADGQNSWVSSQLGIAVEEREYAHSALVTNLDFDQSINQSAYERFVSDGAITLLPLNQYQFKQRRALVWIGPKNKMQDFQALSNNNFLHEFHEAIGVFKSHSRELMATSVGARKVYPLNRATRAERVRPRCVLLGNAAQTLHPIAAQGFNLAVRDIQDLCEILIQDISHGHFGSAECLTSFSKMRQPDVDRVKHFVDALTNGFVNSSKTLPGPLKDAAILSFELIPGAKSALSRFAMGGGYGV